MDRKEKELDLWKKWKDTKDNTYLNTLLISYDPLIQKEVNIFKNSPLPEEALKLRALSLAKNAFENYDPSKSQLNTHVTNNLKKLNRFVYEHQNIGKMPEHRVLKISQYKSVKEQLTDQLNREPTAFEIADEMKIPLIEIERLETELRQDLQIKNESADEEGRGFFLDAQVYSNKTLEAVHFVYYSLDDPIDQKILELYFGLFGNPKSSILSIADQLKISYTKANKRLKELAAMVAETEEALS